MARTVGRIAPKTAENELKLEARTLREVSATVDWNRGGYSHLGLRLLTGRSTNNEYSLEVEPYHDPAAGGSRDAVHCSGMPDGSFAVSFTNLEALVALMYGLEQLIARARAEGWHDITIVEDESNDDAQSGFPKRARAS